MCWKNSPSRLLLLLLLFSAPSLGAGLAVKVEIDGLQDPLRHNVLGLLSIARRANDQGLSRERLSQLHQLAPREIRTALQPFGHYRPLIQSDLIPPEPPASDWIARYHIDPGPATSIAQLDIRILGGEEHQSQWPPLIARQPLRQGAVLDHRLYEESRQNLLQGVQELGYLDARYTTSRVEVDAELAQAKVILHLDTGPAYRVGETQVDQSLFSDRFMDRYLSLRPGDPLTSDNLAQLRRSLSSSGYFSSVLLNSDPQQADADHRVPLEITLTPAKANKYRARIGYGTDSGVGLRLDWNRRYLTRRGHHFNLGTLAVQDKNKLIVDFGYEIPLFPAQQTWLELAARHESKDLTYQDIGLEQGDQTRLAHQLLELRLHHRRSLAKLDFSEIISLGYITDRYDIFSLLFGDQPAEVQDFIGEVLGEESLATLQPRFHALIPGIAWVYQRSNHRIFPSHGEYLELSLRGALNGLASNLSFVQTEVRGILIRPLFGDDRLIARAHLGYTQVDSEDVLGLTFNQLPEAYEFRTGGDSSVRGYAYESLVGSDAITGGKHLLTASIEYEKRLSGDWSLAAFYDIGNAFNDPSSPKLKAGTGIGARWYSPVGLVRLDLAFALDDHNTPWRIHFRIGPEF